MFGGGLFTRDDGLIRGRGNGIAHGGGLAHPQAHSSSSGNIAGLYGGNGNGVGEDVNRQGGDTDMLTAAFGAIGVTDHPSRSATAPLLPFENGGFGGHTGKLSDNGSRDNQSGQGGHVGANARNPAQGYGGDSGHSGGAYVQQQQQAQMLQQMQQQQQMGSMGGAGIGGFDAGAMGMGINGNTVLAAAMAQNGGMPGFGAMDQLGGMPGMGNASVNQTQNGNQHEMAEVYQAAYAAAFYAQQQQLQQLLRLQAQVAQRGGAQVGLDQAALAAAAAGLLGQNGMGAMGGMPAGRGGGYGNLNGAFGGASNGYVTNKGYVGYAQNGYGNGGRDDGRARGGKGPRGRGGGMNGRGRDDGNGRGYDSGGGQNGMHRVHSSSGMNGMNGNLNVMSSVDSAAEVAEMDARFGSVGECLGQIATLARDQHGCRFLQRKFDEDGVEAVDSCFPEILDEVVDLMMDPFGNYLVQKLLECCVDEQRVKILKAVAKTDEDDLRDEKSSDGSEKDEQDDGSDAKPSITLPYDNNSGTSLQIMPHLVSVALNTHGTRAVQKLVETLKTPTQIDICTKALQPGVVTLIKDLNGNHVIQRCLQRLSASENQFVYDAARLNCVEIATHRHGCCVLQRCVDHADDEQRKALVEAIAAASLILSQDPFGNYVVQYVLDLGFPWCNARVMSRLTGTYAELSTQKFSSNVVEKCLKRSADCAELEQNRDAVVREIMNSPLLDRLLMDPYGNYVVQSSLSVTHGALRNELVERIKPHLPLIKNSPFGKRILRLLLEHKK